MLRLAKGTVHVAWVDITASGSVGHIYAKENWAKKVNIFAEVTYPSLTVATRATMVMNKSNMGTLSKEEFEKRLAEGKLLYQRRKARWKEIGQELQVRKLSKEVVEKTGVPKSSRDLGVEAGKVPREFIAGKLQETFKTEEVPDEKMVPSILVALGVNESSWGYTTGYSASEGAGEAWLVDNEPPPPAPELRRQGAFLEGVNVPAELKAFEPMDTTL